MTSVTDAGARHAVDTAIIVYAQLRDHPAGEVCREALRGSDNWLSTSLNLLEIAMVLTKVYDLKPQEVGDCLGRLRSGSIAWTSVDPEEVQAAWSFAIDHRIDVNDAVLLRRAIAIGAKDLATDDRQLIEVAKGAGINAWSPIPGALRPQIAAWEAKVLPPKGLARILHHIHRWLSSTHPAVAPDFLSATGLGSRLP